MAKITMHLTNSKDEQRNFSSDTEEMSEECFHHLNNRQVNKIRVGV